MTSPRLTERMPSQSLPSWVYPLDLLDLEDPNGTTDRHLRHGLDGDGQCFPPDRQRDSLGAVVAGAAGNPDDPRPYPGIVVGPGRIAFEEEGDAVHVGGRLADAEPGRGAQQIRPAAGAEQVNPVRA